MTAKVLERVISILPINMEKMEMPTCRVYSKNFEISKFPDLNKFDWQIVETTDEVFVEFTDKSQAKIFYRSLNDLKLICYVNFL